MRPSHQVVLYAAYVAMAPLVAGLVAGSVAKRYGLRLSRFGAGRAVLHREATGSDGHLRSSRNVKCPVRSIADPSPPA
jgi:hypothetical protein